MSTLERYIKHYTNSGPELVLETAARDAALTDAEYQKLWIKMGKPRKLGARDYAREKS